MTMPRQLERNSRDAPNFISTVDFGVESLRCIHASWRSEVNAAEKCPDNDQIDPANAVAPERRTIDKRFEDGYRPQVGIVAEQLPKVEQTVLAFFAGRQMIVFR